MKKKEEKKKMKRREKEDEKTTLSVSVKTRERIKEFGLMSDTVDDLINRMLDFINERRILWTKKSKK